MDVVDTIIEYAKQETIRPLKGAGRWLAFGLMAAGLIGFGICLLLLGLLRLLQTMTGTAFSGSWSFAPYAIVFVVSLCLIFLTLSRVNRRSL